MHILGATHPAGAGCPGRHHPRGHPDGLVTIIALSMGAPGVPGGNLVCISILLPTIGIPAEAVSIVKGIYSLVGMSQTMTNVNGDTVVTTIVAIWEKDIDLEKFGQ